MERAEEGFTVSQSVSPLPPSLSAPFVTALRLLVNAFLGMKESLKAKNELRKLTEKLVSTVSVSRDGVDSMLPVTALVPGDVALLVAGNLVPADCEWVSGDVVSVDTAALTGESMPRKYPSSSYGRLILSGSTIKAGECYVLVRETGERTEIGQGQKEITKDRTTAR
jgi:P-type E1-E2 ATPase